MTPEYIGYSDVGMTTEPIFTTNQPTIQLDDNGTFKYRIDFDALTIDDSIGAICVSRPTNPTGNVLSDRDISKLSDIAEAHRVPLIIDGAYGLPFPDILFTPATLNWSDNTVLCLSLSKLGLPGVRTGIIIAAPELIEMIGCHNSIYNLAPSAVGPSLVTRLIQSGQINKLCQETIKPFYLQRSQWTMTRLLDAIKGLPVRVHRSEGAMFLWLWCKDLPIDSQILYQRLKARGVLVVPGNHFFPGMEDIQWRHKQECLRISYAGDLASLERGITIIAEEIKNAYQG